MNIAIVGATGLVGREILKILVERGISKNNNVDLFASSKSDGLVISEKNETFVVKELCQQNLKNNYNFALFSAGGQVSKKWASEFISRGAYVIDNSSAFRREEDVPLVVPEVNLNAIQNKKLIANPNCSTIGAVLPIFLLKELGEIKRIIVSTYQAVSGAGQKGVFDLRDNTTNKFSHFIKNNLIPQIDIGLNNGYTFEEDKMEFELKKILDNQKLKICATCVRVPIENCHSESINIEFDKQIDIDKAEEVLKKQKGIKVLNSLENLKYPMPILANGKDDILVGRLRKDTSHNNAINFFICFDNIRKGAALNAVQILEGIIATTNKFY